MPQSFRKYTKVWKKPGPKGPKRKIFKKYRQIFIQCTIVPNFNMIGPFLTSLGCPDVFGKNRSQGPKKEDFQKMKKKTRYSSNTSVLNFSMIRPFLTSLGCLKVLGKTHTHCQIIAQLKLRIESIDSFLFSIIFPLIG